MRNDEFKRHLRRLVRQELEGMDFQAIIHEALARTDLRALVQEALHERLNITNATGPVQQRVLH